MSFLNVKNYSEKVCTALRDTVARAAIPSATHVFMLWVRDLVPILTWRLETFLPAICDLTSPQAAVWRLAAARLLPVTHCYAVNEDVLAEGQAVLPCQ